jgi:protein required for attachment to host cells
MKRSELVKMLISEGMSEKTLVNFSDKQLSDLHERMVIDADKLKDPKLQAIANDPNIEVEVKEDLKGNQKKLDKNHNGKIDGQDFKILKGQKKKKSVKTDTKDKEVKEWVESLAENNYHSFTSKNEIMEMIQFKLQEAGPNVNIGHNGVPEFMTHDGDVETKPAKPKVTPGTKPKPHNPNQPGPFTKPKPKAEKK